MTRAYRIVSPRYPPFDGTGTHRWGSRWVSPGRWVVHAAETYSVNATTTFAPSSFTMRVRRASAREFGRVGTEWRYPDLTCFRSEADVVS